MNASPFAARPASLVSDHSNAPYHPPGPMFGTGGES